MIQPKLDGSLVLVSPVTLQDCNVVVDNSKGYYLHEGKRVQDSNYHWLQGIVFALLSVHSPYHATVAAAQALQEVDIRDKYSVYYTLRNIKAHDGVVMYAGTKASWIGELVNSVYRKGVSFSPQGMEDMEYREYLRSNIKGLAYAKSSFATMCVKGIANVCCIDTHMHRLWTGKVQTRTLTPSVYLDMEARVRTIAQQHGVPCSVAQHCLWDSIRGERTRLMP